MIENVQRFEEKTLSWQDYNKGKKLKIESCHGEKIKKLKHSSNDLLDSDKNRIINGTLQADKFEGITAVAHHELVTPAYLIQLERKESAHDFAKNVLYNEFDVPMYKKEHFSLNSCLSEKKLAQNFFVVLEKEIEANQQGKIDFLKAKFDYIVKSLAQQLSFKISCLLEISINDCIKYKTELLSSKDKDYQFVLRSINDKHSNENLSIRYLFRINPQDQNEANFINNVPLYLHGIKANKVLDILTSGYNTDFETVKKKCKEECFGEDVLRSKRCSCFFFSFFQTGVTKRYKLLQHRR